MPPHEAGGPSADPRPRMEPASRWPCVIWLSGGLGLLAIAAALMIVSSQDWGPGGIGPSGWRVLSLCVLSGAVYLGVVALSGRFKAGASHVAFILIIGAAMRVLLGVAPITQCDDFNRYLWDGAVIAAGVNPYRYSPKQIVSGQIDEKDASLRALYATGRDVVTKINHPNLRTIYPPVAQCLFAVASRLTPLRPGGWLTVLLCIDLITTGLIILLLRQAGLSPAYLAVYLWNPLVVFETYNQLHLDLAVAPMLLLAAWAMARRRPVVAGAALACAAGVKLWPILLGGFLVGAFRGDKRRLALALGTMAVVTAILAVAFGASLGGDDSGLATYAGTWRGAELAYSLFGRAGWWIKDFLSLPGPGEWSGRAIMMCVLTACCGWLGFQQFRTMEDLCTRMTMISLLVLVLSPVLWPWYFVAAIPLAAASGRSSLLIWTVLLWLIYPLRAHRMHQLSLALVIHLPMWAILAVETARIIRARRLPKAPADV